MMSRNGRFRSTTINFQVRLPPDGAFKNDKLNVAGRFDDPDFRDNARKAIEVLYPGSALQGMAPTYGYLHYVVGDLLNQEENKIIAHQANCLMAMYSGIARSISNIYPDAKQADIDFTLSAEERFGKCSSVTTTGTNGLLKMVYNLYGQFEPGVDSRKTSYEALRTALVAMMEHLHEKGIDDSYSGIGVPYKLGCGLAGGHWPTVESILQKVAAKYDRDIYVYVLPQFASEVFEDGEQKLTLNRAFVPR